MPSRDWGDMGVWDDITNAIGGAASDVGGAVSTAAKDVGGAFAGIPSTVGADLSWDASKLGLTGGSPSPTAPAPKGGGVVPTPDNPTVDTTNQQVATANSAMDSLIAQYASSLGQVDPYIGGAVGAADASKAAQIGQSIGGPGVQAPQGNAQLSADAQAFQKANDQGAQGVTKALGDVRSADAQALQVSPYAGLLTALTSGTTYRAETNPQTGALPGAANTMPAWLQAAYSNAVGSNALTVSGATTPNAASNSVGTTNATNPSTTATGVTGGP